MPEPQPQPLGGEGGARRRVVITGMGAITCLGLNVPDFWQGLLAGRSGIGPITQFDASAYPCRIAAEVKGFDPRQYIDFKEARRMARCSHFAVAAARQSLEDARLTTPFANEDRVGVLLGTGVGGLPEAIEGIKTMQEKGGMRLNPFAGTAILANMPTFHVANTLGAKGYNSTVVTACAAGTQSVGEATAVIRRGAADVMLTGGVEAIVCEMAIAVFCVMRALTTRNDEPEKASRPFDANRDGFVLGEGAGILVLEELSHALGRGAPIYAEVLGHAANSDAYHVAAPDPEARGAILAMREALADAGITPEQVDYINAHGTGTPLNDAAETLAIKQVFGEYACKVPVSSTKSMIGHAMGAAGALEAMVCALTIRDQIIHPTVNYEFPDPACDLDYVPNQARPALVDITLSNSFGLGSQNACLVLGRFRA
ncbi:MAG: beta-ketoacyl-ACP synthase II [Chloroflexi bacterium]|nr:beta-ketoacyl-ACP synthase II [Chloroflexota bacterium]